MESIALAKDIDNIPMSELANYHQELIEKYINLSQQPTLSPDAKALMTFNGYYTLNTATGAFFAIDTNIVVHESIAAPVYDVALLVSLDGTTSARYPFTGTFDGTSLKQTGADGLDIELTIIRTDGSDGTTAKCSGTIAINNQPAKKVSGSTYNNPIPIALYNGDYYYTMADKSVVKVMSIQDETVMYDNGENNGQLQQVPGYVYNLNMYFFSFTQGENSVRLIMGTAAAQGFACNNMIVNPSAPKPLITRALMTITKPDMAKFSWIDIGNKELASFSGYYQVPSIAPLAFVSIQAQYATMSESLDWDMYAIMISISLDGVTSRGYYYDPLTMKFENGTLTMPNESIKLTFNREYNAKNGSLVSITGSVYGHSLTGYTLFNPVPLSVFGGVPLTNSSGDTLTVTNDNEVIYNEIKMDKIIYVPLMYILAYPITDTKVEMSFGTDGLKGNTCIVIDSSSGTTKTTCVYAIPNTQ